MELSKVQLNLLSRNYNNTCDCKALFGMTHISCSFLKILLNINIYICKNHFHIYIYIYIYMLFVMFGDKNKVSYFSRIVPEVRLLEKINEIRPLSYCCNNITPPLVLRYYILSLQIRSVSRSNCIFSSFSFLLLHYKQLIDLTEI